MHSSRSTRRTTRSSPSSTPGCASSSPTRRASRSSGSTRPLFWTDGARRASSERQPLMLASRRYFATVWGSFLSTATSARYLVRSSVVKDFDTSFSALLTSALTFEDLMTGTTFWARNRFFVSSRTTSLSVSMVESVEKMLATWMSPFFSAALVSGPPGSSGLNSLKVRPYSFLRPTTPWYRFANSGPAPRMNLLATGFRSSIFLRWYLLAVSEVTVKVSLSSAADCSVVSVPFGRTFCSAASTSSGVLTSLGTVPPGERAASRAPLYSGIMSIEPSLSALRYSSRAPMLNLRLTLTPLPSRDWEYISASSSFSGKFADPTVIVEEPPELEPPDAVGSPPQALNGNIAATTVASATSLVFVSIVNLSLAASWRRRRWGLAEYVNWRCFGCGARAVRVRRGRPPGVGPPRRAGRRRSRAARRGGRRRTPGRTR